MRIETGRMTNKHLDSIIKGLMGQGTPMEQQPYTVPPRYEIVSESKTVPWRSGFHLKMRRDKIVEIEKAVRCVDQYYPVSIDPDELWALERLRGFVGVGMYGYPKPLKNEVGRYKCLRFFVE